MKTLLYAYCTLLMLSMTFYAQSHELSTSFISVETKTNGKLEGEIKLKLLDLKEAIVMDIDNNGELTWKEIVATKPDIIEYLTQHLTFSKSQVKCLTSFSQNMQLQDQSGSTYLVIPIKTECIPNGNVQVSYTLLFDVVANHKAIVSLNDGLNEYLSVVKSKEDAINFNIDSTGMLQTFGAFVYQGIFHILIGFDHILFLLTLLLTVSFYRTNREWQAITSKAQIFKRTLWIVTSFTLAHSITLSGTALGVIPQFGSWVEVIIAASILFNVINNVFPVVKKLTLITFAFGLIHGMGFAGALTEFGLPSGQKTIAVLAFNIGVELGQILLIAVILPVLIASRRSQTYKQIVLPCLSSVIGILAVYWMIARV